MSSWPQSKRSWVYKYCKQLTRNKCQCIICMKILSTPKDCMSNVNRHIKHLHQVLYDKETKKTPDKTRSLFIDMSNPEYVDSDVMKNPGYGNDNTGLDENAGPETNTSAQNAFDLNESDSDYESKIRLLCKQFRLKNRRRNCFWNFIKTIEKEKVYSCLFCYQTVKYRGNIMRHIKTLHKLQYKIITDYMKSVEHKALKKLFRESQFLHKVKMAEDEVENIESTKNMQADESEETKTSQLDNSWQESDIFNFNENDSDFENKIRLVCGRPGSKTRATSCFWNFFKEIKKDSLYSCLSCKRTIKIQHSNLGNIKRHVRTRHKLQYDIIMDFIKSQGLEEDTKLEEYAFTKIADNEYKCKSCEETVICSEEDDSPILEHINKKHSDE